jgi:hypothetical protein
MFGWKFIPTLIAVIYTQLTTILFDDVKRTEPFARLARSAGSVPSASRTILETPRTWWVTLAHGFNKKRNGGQRSWVLIMACLINVLAFLGISPLSSALLHTDEIQISRPLEVTRLVPKKNSALKPVDDRDMYFRTTGALLQNVTTSPWISSEYSILPFWPSDSKQSPWNGPSAQAPQIWQAESTVFHNDLQCSKLELAGNAFYDYNITDSYTTKMASVRLDSDDGCQYNISLQPYEWENPDSFISWSDANHLAYQDGYAEADPISNDKCRGDEVIILSTKWLSYSLATRNKTEFFSNITAWGYTCNSKLTMATLPVVASVSNTELKVNFDLARFREAQVSVPESLLNHTALMQIYTDPKWFQYIPSAGFVRRLSEFSGVSTLLATQYALNATRMMQATDLVEKAGYVRGRHFGELLRSSLDASGGSETETFLGEQTVFERRVTVSMEAAALLAGLFFVSSLLLIYVTCFSRTTQRPLNLVHDPATVLGSTSLVASSPDVLLSLRELDQTTAHGLKLLLGHHKYVSSPGRIHGDVVDGQLAVGGTRPLSKCELSR